VQKTWETMFPKVEMFAQPDKAESLTVAVKQWIHNWMDGSNCGFEDQYEFSKDMLLHVLKHNQDFLTILGVDQCQQIWHWINTKFLPLKIFTAFYPKGLLRCFEDFMNNVVRA